MNCLYLSNASVCLSFYALFTSGGVFKYSSARTWLIKALAVPESIGKSDFRRIIGLSLLITLFRSIFTYKDHVKLLYILYMYVILKQDSNDFDIHNKE